MGCTEGEGERCQEKQSKRENAREANNRGIRDDGRYMKRPSHIHPHGKNL